MHRRIFDWIPLVGRVARSSNNQDILACRILNSFVLQRIIFRTTQAKIDDVRTLVNRPANTTDQRIVGIPSSSPT
jgi:hypothetical protein